MTDYTGAFRRNYGPLIGSNWVTKLDTEARRIFSAMGREFGEHGHCGGVARARTADRDERGRFIRNEADRVVSMIGLDPGEWVPVEDR